MRKTISILLILLMVTGPVWATTTIARVKAWTAEKLYAADLNAEFQNIIDYLNNNIAWVTNVTATATEINQLHVNRFANSYRFAAAVEDSANETMDPGFIYTNNGRAVFDSVRVDTLQSPSTGTQLAGTFFMVPLTDLTGWIGNPAKRLRSFTADTGRVQVAALDSLTGNTISDSWTLTPKTNSTGRIGAFGKHFQSLNGDTLAARIVQDSLAVTNALRVGTGAFWVSPALGRVIVGTVVTTVNDIFTINAPTDGVYGFRVLSSQSTGNSNGGDVDAGTNASDACFGFRTKAGGNIMYLRGDASIGVHSITPGNSSMFIAGTHPLVLGVAATDTASATYALRVNNGGSGSGMNAGDLTWTSTSDKNLKENFTPVDSDSVANALLSIPAPQRYNFKFETYWNKTTDDSLKTQAQKDAYAAQCLVASKKAKVGFMAQDFYAVSKLLHPDNADSLMISGTDLIYALTLTVRKQQAQINDLLARVDKLEGK